MEDIVISILVPTYGHEKYIAEALNSILKQKTQYKYEVIVGEDASPDNTKIILQTYEKKYPDIFTMIYRNINWGSGANTLDLIHRASGKYTIILEGDDFWIAEDKLERQVLLLEEHPEYTAVAHNCLIVDEYSSPTTEKYPECKTTKYTLFHFRQNILPGQTTTILYRTELLKSISKDEIWAQNPLPGDRILILGTVAKGAIYCIQERMSAYRHIISDGISYSANAKRNFNEEINWWKLVIDFAKRLNNQEAEIAAEGRYFATIFFEGLIKKKISFWQACQLYQYIEHKFKVFIIKINDFIIRKVRSR